MWTKIKEHVSAKVGNYLPLSGGTMTGPLILSGAPERDLQAATKRYVDDAASKASIKHDDTGYYIEV